MPKPLAVQLYSVRDLIDADREGVLRRLAEIGFGAIEPFRPEDDPAGLRAIADDLGLQVCAAHAGGLVRDADPDEVFDAVHTLGTTLVIHPGGGVHDGRWRAPGGRSAQRARGASRRGRPAARLPQPRV